MLKGELLRGLLYITFLNLIILDFFSGIPWYVQYGPIIISGFIILLTAFLEKDDEHAEEKEAPLLYRIFLMVALCLLIFGMNIFVGEPSTELFNIKHTKFWIFFIVLPVLGDIFLKVKKREVQHKNKVL